MWRYLYSWRHAIREIVIIEAGFMAAALAWCLYRNNLTLQNYGWALMAVAGLALGFATISALGSYGSTRSFEYQYASTISRDSLENQAHAAEELDRAYGFVTNTLLVSMIAFVIGFSLVFFV
jgi:hypothetical protein